jgi:hypothetical protein
MLHRRSRHADSPRSNHPGAIVRSPTNTGPENPTVSGLDACGVGTSIDTDLSDVGGATGSGMPPKPLDAEDEE